VLLSLLMMLLPLVVAASMLGRTMAEEELSQEEA
jgi:hypothetical protein